MDRGCESVKEDYAELPCAQRQRLDEYAVTAEPELRGRGDEGGTPMVVSPPFQVGAGRPGPAVHPIAFANEASKTFSANASYARVQLTADDIQGAIPPTRLMASGWDSPCTGHRKAQRDLGSLR
mmetsp:Transcript_11636/g.30013  ORF Transcript_11636/g.30013 Transcript_11636/m.30013 type:complete len:124 (-) Transcript_11636:134-505(-)